MFLLHWGKRHKVSPAVESIKPVRGLIETIAVCDTDPVFVYNKYCKSGNLERNVTEVNAAQLAAVQAYKCRLLDDCAGITTVGIA
jgi:hypothetical protein